MDNVLDTTRRSVKDYYARRAKASAPQAESCCGSEPAADDGCCSTGILTIEEKAAYPQGQAPPSWGCGNPTALVAMEPGQVVLDLGSGAGFDAFQAAQRVAPDGRVIGVDMTEDMLALARQHARHLGLADVTEFRQGYIEALPVDDASVDVVMSNCVINLSPDKDAVFREAYRVLRRGGWLTVSDIVTHGEMPASAREDAALWAECISGAIEEEAYLAKVRAAGFDQVEVTGRTPAGEIDGVRTVSLTFRAFKSN